MANIADSCRSHPCSTRRRGNSRLYRNLKINVLFANKTIHIVVGLAVLARGNTIHIQQAVINLKVEETSQ